MAAEIRRRRPLRVVEGGARRAQLIVEVVQRRKKYVQVLVEVLLVGEVLPILGEVVIEVFADGGIVKKNEVHAAKIEQCVLHTNDGSYRPQRYTNGQ